MTRLTLLIAALIAPLLVVSGNTPAAAVEPKPNLMLIYVDDMRADDMAYMDWTREFFAANGTVFVNGISPHPLCCPARGELMTGQYAQNNGVYHNSGAYGGYDALVAAGMTRLTPQWFKAAGYDTAYVGKYLNGYPGANIPGVNFTEALSGNVYRPYDFTSWNNGVEQVRAKHTTIWTGDRTSNLIASALDPVKPFFTVSAFLAPHRMKRDGEWVPPYARVHSSVPVPIPPRKYRTLVPGDEVPPSVANPSYNEADISDKPSVAQGPTIDSGYVQSMHTARVLSLYAVDDAIKKMVTDLIASGEYANTVIAFTSDNGYLMGEHRMEGKDQPYIESLRVPYMIAGPGVPVGVSHAPVTTVDLPGTLAALAGVTPTRVQDGTNALSADPYRKVLIQSGSTAEHFDWRGIFTPRYTYVEHSTGETEFYDRNADPYEMTSTPTDPTAGMLAGWLDQMETCAGAACVSGNGA